MDTKTIFRLIILILIYLISCRKIEVEEQDRPLFSYDKLIENPPNIFAVLFSFQSIGSKTADIIFPDTSVWFIEKLGDPSYMLQLMDYSSDRIIEGADTLFARGGYHYQIVVSSTFVFDPINYLVGFKKLPDSLWHSSSKQVIVEP
ncbi:MAG: hypothetical protein WCR58_03210 [Bacteroidales bacterium]|jgi:hypothetical protein|nr:hypothetical protein [Bacteroidales bacterium]MDD3701299.1 hypothetical protein [Bacteroidales bacterium]MDY0368428.1 hypothetical protein [Bacteroidales bacterium]